MSPSRFVLGLQFLRFSGQSALGLQNSDDIKQCLGQVMAEVSGLDQEPPLGVLDVQDPTTFQVGFF